ncbi:MAG: MBOAT family O-acyltransferase [Pseudomonadota bacterium]|nr:MBOAT family O-acyltransferase [Pseudomonadota bacterium]
MTFVQVEFLAFFTVVFVLYWGVRARVAQNVLLLLASALFYGWVHPWWLVLLYVAALLDYGAGLAMERWPTHKRLVLVTSIGANLALLGYYKYWDFFVENAAGALDALGVANTLTPLGILLPAGISFYTFQSMAYSFDVYRGELKPRKNLFDYLLAVSLFCHLVAGPVQRAGNLLQQAETDRRFDWEAVRSGFALAMWGAFKKVCIADTISPYTDKIFSVDSPSTSMVVAGTLAFALQILTDFSGYTDIARGTARMIGFDLMENFRNPYLATNPSEFWNRWHISFSTWIRDYVYIPFGGSRGGFWFVTRNTFAAMVLSGIWHGASWNFALWGAYHGALLTGYRLVVPRVPAALKTMPGARVIATTIMFSFTCFGWFLFRELDVARIVALLSQDPFRATPEQNLTAAIVLGMTGVLALPLFGALAVQKWVLPTLRESAWYLPAQTAAWAGFGLSMFTFARMSANDFIYFQF